MYPERGMVLTYRWSDDISTRLDDHNTLTHQSADTNDEPRYPLLGPVTWNISSFTDTLHLQLHIQLRLRPRASPSLSQ